MNFFLSATLLLASNAVDLANAQVSGESCLFLTTCESCLTYGATCAWDLGIYCTGGSCTDPNNCVTPNWGGQGDDKAAICALPEAQPANDGVICSGFTDCNNCIDSQNCAWENGNTCTETCTPGQNCVTPNYGGMGADKAAICLFPEAINPTPTTGRACGGFTSCEACLVSGFLFSTAGCAWSTGSICTQTCPGGDASTCVTPNYGNNGSSIINICALPQAKPITGTPGAVASGVVNEEATEGDEPAAVATTETGADTDTETPAAETTETDTETPAAETAATEPNATEVPAVTNATTQAPATETNVEPTTETPAEPSTAPVEDSTTAASENASSATSMLSTLIVGAGIAAAVALQ